MANTTSGTATFDKNFSIDEIVEEAYERIGQQKVSGYQLKSARRSLNILFQEWGNRGIHYWEVGELDLDLVEVSPESKPPVARLMDYGKYKYELAQKAKESKKKQVKISVKEIQLKPKIDTNDFKIKLNKSRKFLDSGDKVKFTMRFRGREAEHPEFGQKVLELVIQAWGIT